MFKKNVKIVLHEKPFLINYSWLFLVAPEQQPKYAIKCLRDLNSTTFELRISRVGLSTQSEFRHFSTKKSTITDKRALFFLSVNTGSLLLSTWGFQSEHTNTHWDWPTDF